MPDNTPSTPPLSVSEAVAARRSIRAFLGRPVARDVLERVLNKARMAPSSTNFQPWEPVLVTGAPLADLSARMLASHAQQPPEYELMPATTPEAFHQRRAAIMAPRLEALGIARDDQAARDAHHHDNYRFFGAPACLFTFFRRGLSPAQWGSLGLWLQTVMLLLVEEGLGSCPLESVSIHARLIKDRLGVSDESHLFWCGLAIGWPDREAPVNNYPRPRVALAEQVRFVGFEQGA